MFSSDVGGITQPDAQGLTQAFFAYLIESRAYIRALQLSGEIVEAGESSALQVD
jgi:hypothetical protein